MTIIRQSRQIQSTTVASIAVYATFCVIVVPLLSIHSLLSGLPIDDQGELVGDSDGASFGVGKAPSSAKAGHSAVVNARRKSKKGKDKNEKADRAR